MVERGRLPRRDPDGRNLLAGLGWRLIDQNQSHLIRNFHRVNFHTKQFIIILPMEKCRSGRTGQTRNLLAGLGWPGGSNPSFSAIIKAVRKGQPFPFQLAHNPDRFPKPDRIFDETLKPLPLNIWHFYKVCEEG